MTKGSLGDVKNLRFTTVLGVRHARRDERVAAASEKFAFYHSFERPTRHEVTKGSIGEVQKFAFYHSFERPTRTK